MDRHVPILLARARALLRLSGGPADELARAELKPAAAAVLALHEGLVGDRVAARPETYKGRALGAYLLWWWPQTYAKTQGALRMAPMPKTPRILDVGSGPAPAALAAKDLLGGDATCFDVSEEALAEARALGIAKTTRELPQADFDVTLVANVLSEVPDPAALLRKLTGTLVILEPALRETGRALLTLRDRLLNEGFTALAPCLTQRPCPALENAKDWCTAELPWTPPKFVRQLADATGLRADEMLSFAPLILRRGVAPQPPLDVWRVVGVPQPEKGKKRLWVCSDEGRTAVGRLDKHAAPGNAAFDELTRGDLVRLGNVTRKGDGLRVEPGATVERLP